MNSLPRCSPLFAASLAALTLGVIPACAQEAEVQEHFVDVGAPGDEAVIGEGIYQREGPVENMGPVFDSTFRWCQDRLTLNLPVFPGEVNLVSIRLRARPGHELLVESEGQSIAIVRPRGAEQLDFLLLPDVVGGRDVVPVTLRAPVVLGPASERDPRVLYGPLDWVRVRGLPAPDVAGKLNAITTKIGDPGDEGVLGEGFYTREGPYEKFGDFYRDTFRWAQPGFALNLSVFRGGPNLVILHADIAGKGTQVFVRVGDEKVGALTQLGPQEYTLELPAELVGDRQRIAVNFEPDDPLVDGNPADSRRLFCALSRVTVIGQGDASAGQLRLPPAHSLPLASYLCRRLSEAGTAPDVAVCPRIAASETAAPKMPAHLAQEAAVILANGCRPVLWDEPRDDAVAEAAIRSFAEPRRAAWGDTLSVPYVAVIEPAAYAAARMQPGTDGQASPALVQAVTFLNRLHYPCDVISDRAGAEVLNRYSLVVVPSLAWYADDLWPKLEAYVAAGGALLATGSASLARDDVGGRSLALSRVLGVELTDRPQVAGLLPAPGYFTEIGPSQVVELTTSEELLPLCSTDRPEHETLKAPGLTVNQFGRGRAVYLAGPVFVRSAARLDPLVMPALKQALRAALPEPLLVLTDAENVEVALRQRGDTLYIHLVNCAQPADFGAGPAHLAEALPVGPSSLRVRTSVAPNSVTLVPGGRRLDFEGHDGWLEVKVPRFDVHVAIAVQGYAQPD